VKKEEFDVNSRKSFIEDALTEHPGVEKALSEAAVDKICSELQCLEKEERMGIMHCTTSVVVDGRHSLTAQQLSKLLSSVQTDSEKMNAVEKLNRSLKDPKNAGCIITHFREAAQKKKVTEMLSRSASLMLNTSKSTVFSNGDSKPGGRGRGRGRGRGGGRGRGKKTAAAKTPAAAVSKPKETSEVSKPAAPPPTTPTEAVKTEPPTTAVEKTKTAPPAPPTRVEKKAVAPAPVIPPSVLTTTIKAEPPLPVTSTEEADAEDARAEDAEGEDALAALSIGAPPSPHPRLTTRTTAPANMGGDDDDDDDDGDTFGELMKAQSQRPTSSRFAAKCAFVPPTGTGHHKRR
jgi:hypothetical protein